MRPGARLPAVREIMDTYRVSQATVSRAIEQLRQSGIIESAIGKGMYVCERPDKKDRKLHRVDLLFFSNQEDMSQPTFHSELFEHLNRQIGERNGWLRTTTMPWSSSISDIISKVEALSCEAVLIVNPNGSEDVFDIFFRRQIPCVAMFPSVQIQPANSFMIDNRSVVTNWLDHLFNLGHRRIAFLHNVSQEYYSRDHYQRLQFFYEEYAKAGYVPGPELVRYCGFSPEDAYAATCRLLDDGADFTALICGDINVRGVYQALNRAGFEIGKDISVMGTDDCLWAEHIQPPLTTVRIPRVQIATQAVEMLQTMLETGQLRFASRLVESRLIVRQSTGSVA
ncbi:MAG: substrate-binding domain-containing protein [Planctomycetes bacterium]|nr:substrate-binding domain-containing protein [Planctomycetota bacterium]